MNAIGRCSTVTGIVRDCPPLDAAICAVPAPTAETNPSWLTVTTEGSWLDQKTFAVAIRSSAWSYARAVTVEVAPTTSCSLSGEISIRWTLGTSGANGLSHDANSAA